MRKLFTAMALLLLCLSANSYAWWGSAPYGPAYPGGNYWPNAWPGTGAWPGYGYSPYGNNRGYGSSDWNVKGYMNEWGDTHFVIEYHGNIYEDMTGGAYGYPGYGGYGQPFRGYPYFGGWR